MTTHSTQPVDRLARLKAPHLARELRTIEVMVRIWCRDHHRAGEADAAVDAGTQRDRARAGVCPGCREFIDYATRRLAACPYGVDKPTCSNCRIHCYGPTQRAQVREIMRYAGPRMLLRHPYLALMHIVDGRRAAPPKPRNPRAVAPSRTEPR